MTDIACHSGELEAADYAWPHASLRAHHVPWRALCFKVAEIGRQHVGARPRGHCQTEKSVTTIAILAS